MGAVTEGEIAAAIRSAAVNVFSTMLGIDIGAGEARGGAVAGGPHCGVVALLGLAGEWAGSGSLSCEPEFACRMASRLWMAEYDAVDEDVLDAAAEVANMIIGNVKTALEEKLGPMGLSTPTVVYGRHFEIRAAGNRAGVAVRFTCEEQCLEARISIAPSFRSARVPPGIAGGRAVAG